MNIETKFNIGDGVRYKKHKTIHFVKSIIIDEKGISYQLQTKKGYVEFTVNERFLNKVDNRYKFNLGDKVKVINNLFINIKGRIVEQNYFVTGGNYYHIKTTKSSKPSNVVITVAEEDLEKVK